MTRAANRAGPVAPEATLRLLAAVLSAGDSWRCVAIEPAGDGTLRFSLVRGRERATVAWCVPRRRPGWAPFRDGSMQAAPETAGAHVRARLEHLLLRRRLALLEVRNRELRETRLDDQLFDRLCPDLLRPGVTVIGRHRLERVRHRERDRLELIFIDDDGVLSRAAVVPAPAGHGARFELFAEGEDTPSPDLQRALDLVGFVLALSVPAGCALELSDPAEATRAGDARGPGWRSAGRGDKDNPFLYDTANNSGLLMSALFQSRGHLEAVFHADRECAGFASYSGGPIETIHLPQWGLRPRRELLRRMRITDTEDLDAIMTGCEDQLEAALAAADRAEPQLLFTLGTCVAKVIGDDMHGALARVPARPGACPRISLETTLSDAEDNYSQLWIGLIEHFDGRARERRERRVNLIGYADPRGRGRDELRRLAGAAGVEIGAFVVPTFDLDELERFGEARANLLLPSQNASEAFAGAAERCSAPVLEGPAPFGFGGTFEWLQALRAAVELEPLPEGWLAAREARAASRWRRLRRQAARHGVAIVITDDHFGSPWPEHRSGVPWFALLREMGFALDVIVLPSDNPTLDDARRRVERQRLEELLDGATAARVTHVDSIEGAIDALEEGDFELVYSEVWRDRRVTAAGKTPVSFLDVEMGVEGAVRTLERLLACARAPFYRRFSQYLPRPTRPSR